MLYLYTNSMQSIFLMHSTTRLSIQIEEGTEEEEEEEEEGGGRAA